MLNHCDVKDGECTERMNDERPVICAITDDLATDKAYVSSLREFHIWDNRLSSASNIAGYCSIEEGTHHSCEGCRRMVQGVLDMRATEK